MKFSGKHVILPLAALVMVVGPAFAQLNAPSPKDKGTAFLKAAKGSFKILKRGKVLPSGQITMKFKGTVLIVGLDKNAKMTTAGNLVKEYESKEHNRVAFHGSGTLKIDGTFVAIQWYGRDLDMSWVGQGVTRTYGEFDEKGLTGTFTYAGQKPKYWGSGGMTYVLPLPDYMNNAEKVKVKVNKGG